MRQGVEVGTYRRVVAVVARVACGGNAFPLQGVKQGGGALLKVGRGRWRRENQDGRRIKIARQRQFDKAVRVGGDIGERVTAPDKPAADEGGKQYKDDKNTHGVP